ncbi:serine-arginine protein 55-like [Centruroides vittatus]|nr:serine-arginine protein 55-like isoform X2 [Centruroides sculpturatus]
MGTRVYIGRLSYDIRERDLEKFFKGYGRIREILIKNGFGFVEFDDYRDADDAVYELNGKDLLGERVTVEHARGPPRGNDLWGNRNRGRRGPPQRRRTGRDSRYGPPTRTDYRLIVENLSSRVSWQDLKDFMRQAGEVTYADAHKEYRNKGVVEFASLSDLKTALEKLDNTELNGRRIRLKEDRYGGGGSSSSSRRRSRSRSRSRSASASRSRSKSSSRSRSQSKSRSRSVSRSQSRSRSHSKSKSASRSRSRSHSQSRSRSQSKSPRRSRSKSPSPDRARSKTPEQPAEESPERE